MKTTTELTTANFQSEVLSSDRPVLVDFWAEWCGPCKMIAPVLDEIATQQGDRLKVAKLNVDHHPEVAQQYGVRGLPTLLLFSKGQVQKQIVGAVSKKVLLSHLDTFETAN